MAENPRKEEVSRRKTLTVQRGQIKTEEGSLHLEIGTRVTCAITISVESSDRMKVKAMIINCSFKGSWL